MDFKCACRFIKDNNTMKNNMLKYERNTSTGEHGEGREMVFNMKIYFSCCKAMSGTQQLSYCRE